VERRTVFGVPEQCTQPGGAVSVDPLARPVDPSDVVLERSRDVLQVRDPERLVRGAFGSPGLSAVRVYR
jgi:hypothetical protein